MCRSANKLFLSIKAQTFKDISKFTFTKCHNPYAIQILIVHVLPHINVVKGILKLEKGKML